MRFHMHECNKITSVTARAHRSGLAEFDKTMLQVSGTARTLVVKWQPDDRLGQRWSLGAAALLMKLAVVVEARTL